MKAERERSYGSNLYGIGTKNVVIKYNIYNHKISFSKLALPILFRQCIANRPIAMIETFLVQKSLTIQ